MFEVVHGFDRTPEFYANIQSEADAGARHLTDTLTPEELNDYVRSLLVMNAVLRAQMAEQSAMWKPIAIGFARELQAVG